MELVWTVNPRTKNEFARLLIEWKLRHLNVTRRVADCQLFEKYCPIVPHVHVPGDVLHVIDTETQ